ncbi:MAG: type II toxin-antitoxin system VapC family toxin [Deltaproteobacteria bacterium]|nr:type II toxin-antitoxin system VapC family toxin [Deltaproteobacteria bacterium]
MKLALDTNAYRRFADGDHDVIDKVQLAERIAMPVPVVAELRAGFALGTKGAKNESVLTRFLDSERVELLVCDEETTRVYAQLFAQLRRQGTPIPINDVWIAALVLQHRCALLTFDTDFERVPQLVRM